MPSPEEVANWPNRSAMSALCFAIVIGFKKASGCAALQRIDASTCELQYVYVRDEFRGNRIGRLMVVHLIANARDAGYRVMRLETTTFMKDAQTLYASLGFLPRDPCYEVPSAFKPFAVFMELTLGLPKTGTSGRR